MHPYGKSFKIRIFSHGKTAPSGSGPPKYRAFTITLKHHSRQDSSGRVISPTQSPLPDNTQHSQQTNIHDPSGIRTRKPSKLATTDPRLRRRGHRDQLEIRLRVLVTDNAKQGYIFWACSKYAERKDLLSTANFIPTRVGQTAKTVTTEIKLAQALTLLVSNREVRQSSFVATSIMVTYVSDEPP